MPTTKMVSRWLETNKHRFGSHDNLPGEFHRRAIFKAIRPRSLVGIVTPQGGILAGKAVMVFHTHAVLNGGGPHGTPLIADASNTVYCTGAKL